MKTLLTFFAIMLMTMPVHSLNKSEMKMKIGKPLPNIVDNDVSTKTPYAGEISGSFDKSANGYGWYLGFNRKIAWDIGGSFAGPMIGSVYRRLNPTSGSGTIGGTIGEWNGTDLNSVAQDVMTESPSWPSGTPGGRYPYTCAFINGYLFGMFADINYVGSQMEGAYPTFAVCDATFGYNFASWDIGVVAATEGGAMPDDAITGTGDVVYDPADSTYYWSQSWDATPEGIEDAIAKCVVGRSKTPSIASSWEWTDCNDLLFDGTDDTSGITQAYNFHYAYCKDRLGNGTGYGIALAMTTDVDDVAYIDSTEVLLGQKVSYMYTTNWGGDDDSGDWSHNWITDGDKLFQIDPKDLIDWYGSTLTMIDTTTNDTTVITYDDPFITWNISAIATENNIVHLLFKAFPASTQEVGTFRYIDDDDFRGGYYHARGLITDSGVIWTKAKLIGSPVGLETADFNWVASNRNTLSIGYAGFGQVYATWLDRPLNRPTANTWPGTNGSPTQEWYCDAFMTFSCDDGNTWELPTEAEAPGHGHVEIEFEDEPGHIYNVYYPINITNTGTLHEQGFTVASTGKITDGNVEVFAASQYYDSANPLAPPVEDLYDHQQFLHWWKITGTISAETGITSEHVGIDKDFELIQNYPNPFNPSTEIGFKISSDSDVKLTIFNSNGAIVSELIDSRMKKGFHKVEFDGSSMNSGVYFYQLSVDGIRSTKKMVLAK